MELPINNVSLVVFQTEKILQPGKAILYIMYEITLDYLQKEQKSSTK